MIPTAESKRPYSAPPPTAVCWLICILLVALWAVIKLALFPESVMPISYALPPLICVWFRKKRMLWSVAGALAAISTYKVWLLLPTDYLTPPQDWTVYASQLTSILVASIAVHAIISLRERLEHRNAQLEEANVEIAHQNESLAKVNAELEATNEELAQRDLEISSQNEELAEQNEELRTQGEELEQQAEELRVQSEELQVSNQELIQRESILQTLISATNPLCGEVEMLTHLCEAGIKLLGPKAAGVAVLEARGESLHLHAKSGVKAGAGNRGSWPLQQSLARLVMQEKQTAALEDMSLRPDLIFPHSSSGIAFRSILSSPITISGKEIGAVEFYSKEPCSWTKDEFRLAEWVAAQCSSVLTMIRLRTELHRQGGLLEGILDNIPVLLCIWDSDFTNFRLNKFAREILGWTHAEMAQGDFLSKVYPDPAYRQDVIRYLQGREKGWRDLRTTAKDGTVIDISWANVLLPDGLSLGIGVDIRDRLRAEQAVHESERRYRVIGETIPYGVWQADPEGACTYVSDSFLKLTGKTLEQVQELGWLDTLRPEDQQSTREHWLHCVRTGEDFQREHRFRAAHGEERFVLAIGRPVRDERGNIKCWVGINLDITHRRRNEEALRRTTERFALLSEVASELLSATSPQAVVEKLCRKAMQHLGCDVFFNFLADHHAERLELNAWAGISEREAEMLHWLDFGSAVCGCVARDRRRLVAEDVQTSTDRRIELIRSLGVQAYCCHPLTSGDEVIGTLSFGTKSRSRFNDDEIELMRAMTDQIAVAMERIRTEQEVRRAKEAAEAASKAKDEFLAVLSHELRTPLNPALLAATILRAHPDLHPELREDVDIIHRNVELEARLIDDMLDLTRIARGKLSLNRRTVNGCEVLRHAIETCKREALDKQIELQVHLPTTPIPVHADPARLQQVFWNLIKNAVKFTPEKGRVVITAKEVGEGGLLVQVQDDGRGITPEDIGKIFDAFEQGGSTVTHRFGGLGLGLAICKGLVSMHEGRITARSDGAGKGATFIVELPPAPEHAGINGNVPSATRNAAPPARSDVRLRILLVEDHDATAHITGRLLQSFGHEVTIANCIKQALEQFERSVFDLILSDLGLPDGSGQDLLRHLKSKRPVKAIALSGYGMDNDLQESAAAGFLDHLIKPIDADRLREVITKACRADGSHL